MSTPVKVTVTGAAGQIGYALLFRIASGQMLGPEQEWQTTQEFLASIDENLKRATAENRSPTRS